MSRKQHSIEIRVRRAKLYARRRVRWQQAKALYPAAIMFVRVGSFYETFDDDAALCERELQGCFVVHRHRWGDGSYGPLVAGAPSTVIQRYKDRLLSRGYAVGFADDGAEDAAQPERGHTTLTDDPNDHPNDHQTNDLTNDPTYAEALKAAQPRIADLSADLSASAERLLTLFQEVEPALRAWVARGDALTEQQWLDEAPETRAFYDTWKRWFAEHETPPADGEQP